MDNFALIFIVVAALGLFAFWKFTQFIIKVVKKAQPEKSDSSKFSEGTSTLPGNFNEIVNKLEKERERLYNKTKGLFRRAFFRTWFFIACGILLLVATLTDADKLEIAAIIGPLVMSAFIALIGGGIYTLVKKGSNSYTFSKKLKKDLVSQIVTFVNPELSFSGEAIEKADFDKADLFNGSVFTSEDTITGTIEDEWVSISECEQRNSSINNRSNTIITYFDGLFIQLQLKSINLSSPLKFIPVYNIDKNVLKYKIRENSLRFDSLKILRIKEEDEILLSTTKYKAYSDNKEEVQAIINEKFLKVIDFILGKYDYKDVFISIHGDKLYLALGWNQDMFETDAFLKKSLIESNIAEKVHQDIIFINQAIKEVNLINKMHG